MITKVVFRSIFLQRLNPLSTRLFYSCSTQQNQQPQEQFHDLDRAANFYRNSIRRININDKGRGKFTEHHLVRLTKLTEKPSQIPLLFEGYYNYLGHYTVISSKIVDRMLQKVMNFEDAPLQSILEVFSNHCYLGYFPKYSITFKFIQIASTNQQIFQKLLKSLYSSPLIKINRQIIDQLLSLLNSEELSQTNFSSITKLLIQRSQLKLINDLISSQELMLKITSSITERFSQNPYHIMNSNEYIVSLIQSFKNKPIKKINEQISILALVFGRRDLVYESLSIISNKASIQKIFSCIEKAPQSYIQSLVNYLESQELREELKTSLKRFKKISEQSQE